MVAAIDERSGEILRVIPKFRQENDDGSSSSTDDNDDNDVK
jgi:hypothetical protein